MVAFSTVFFARIIDTLGAPAPINFLHFITVPAACGIAICTARGKDQEQNVVAKSFLFGLLILLAIMLTSAILNDVGLINVTVHFLLLGEPFIMLLALISVPISDEALQKIRRWILIFGLINLVLFYVQYPLIDSGHLYAEGFTPQDGAAGVFFVSGAGNYVSASVSVSLSMYFFSGKNQVPRWLRWTMLAAGFYQVHLSDSKQILLALIVAWVILIISDFKNIVKTIKLLVVATTLIAVFWWCIYNIEALKGFTSWVRPEMYGPGGAAPYAKFAGLRIAVSHFESPLNWLFGLGSGHTVGRLGGWFLRDYWSLLGPLGATIHPVSEETDVFMRTFWLTSLDGSSMFNPFFGWAGVWGDIGFVGLGAYLYLSFLVWTKVCLDNFQKFLVLTILVLGLIFTQIEEPGYMLSVAMILGLRWHEHHNRKQVKAKNASEL